MNDTSLADPEDPATHARFGAGPRAAAEVSLDCLIVGAGPAGLMAALYLRRFNRHVMVADAGDSRARYIERTHNFPGFPEGIPGPELLGRLRRQVEDVEATFLQAEITRVAVEPDGGFIATSATTDEPIRARAVLIATGVVDKAPLLPGLEQVMRRGLVRQCPICDGHEHTGQRIAVLGNGPHAEREAVFISHFSRPVGLVALPDLESSPDPDDSFKAALEDGRVLRHRSPAAQAVLQPDGSIGLILQDGSSLPVDVVYAALGCRPRTALALPLGVEQDDGGHLVVDAHCSTRIPGLFAAGDVVKGLAQLAVAVGQGAIAATAIHRHCLQPGPPGRESASAGKPSEASLEGAAAR